MRKLFLILLIPILSLAQVKPAASQKAYHDTISAYGTNNRVVIADTLKVAKPLVLNGSTSGSVTIKPNAVAGTAVYTLPSADGTSGQVLSTNGSGVLSWTTAPSYWELDTDGALMPVAGTSTDSYWELDSDGALMPKP